MRVVRNNISVENGESTIDDLESFALKLSGGSIKDIKFSNEEFLFVIWRGCGKHQLMIEQNYTEYLIDSTELLSVPFRKNYQTKIRDTIMDYVPYNPPHSITGLKVIDSKDVRRLFLKHKIPTGQDFIPERLSVKNSGHQLPREQQRIVLLGQGGYQYKVLEYKKSASK